MKVQGKPLVQRLTFALLLFVLGSCSSGDNPGPAPSNTAGTTWSITPAGGTFQTSDGRATLIVPPNAVNTTTTVTTQLPSTLGAPPVNYVGLPENLVQFTHVTFNTPVTLRFKIPPSIATNDVPFVRGFRKPDNSNVWQALATTIDAPNRIAEVQVSEFSGVGMFGPAIASNEWLVTSAGGTFTGQNGRIGLVVAPGAVSNSYRIRHTPIARSDMEQLPAGWAYVEESGFDFVWSDPTTQFDPAATFKISFTGLPIPCDPSLVAIFTRTDFGPKYQWLPDATGIVAGEATVAVNRLKQHALFCPIPVLPPHVVTHQFSKNPETTTITVSKLEGGLYVPVASQSYVRDEYSSTISFQEGVVWSGSQVSAETLYVSAVTQEVFATTKSLRALNLATNALETIETTPDVVGSLAFDFEVAANGISPDGSVIAAKLIGPSRRVLRAYSRQSHALLSETELNPTDRSNIEAVGKDGTVLLSDARVGGNTIKVVKNGSVRLSFNGSLPRANPEFTTMYYWDGADIVQVDLATGVVLGPVHIQPVDLSITADAIRYYKPTAGGCQLIQRLPPTSSTETILVPLTPCPSPSGNPNSTSTTYMVR